MKPKSQMFILAAAAAAARAASHTFGITATALDHTAKAAIAGSLRCRGAQARAAAKADDMETKVLRIRAERAASLSAALSARAAEREKVAALFAAAYAQAAFGKVKRASDTTDALAAMAVACPELA